jgi:hypothetical protein
MVVGLLLGRWAFALDDTLVAVLLAGICAVAAAAGLLFRATAGGLLAPVLRFAVRAAARLTASAPSERAPSEVEPAQRIDRSVRFFLNPGGWRVWASLVGHLSGRFLGAVEAWIIMTALGMPVSFAGAVFVIAVAHVFVNLVFAFVPSQLGVQEATAYALFDAVGLDPSSAVALMLARRVRGFFWNGVGLALLARGPGRPDARIAPGPPSTS